MNEVVEANYSDMSLYDIEKANLQTIKIIKDSTEFYLKIHLDKSTDKAIVFSNGTYDPKKKTPPIFMRESWSEDYNANCIYVDDRTLHDYKNLRVAYGIGTPQKYYLEEMSLIIKKILHLLSIDDNETIYFGSSSGGYMSIAYSVLHKNSRALVNNARFFVDNTSTATETYKTIFPKLNREEIEASYGDRLSIISLIIRECYVPKITLLMNQQSFNDYEKNYKKFLNECRNNNIDLSKFNVLFYHNYKKAHDTLSRKDTSSIINAALDGNLPILP